MGPMKFLVSRNVTFVFTVRMLRLEISSALLISPSLQTYDEQEATVEADMLRKAGVDLHLLLGLGKNPWGSSLLRLQPCNVSNFYSHNGWLSEAFIAPSTAQGLSVVNEIGI